MTTAKLWKVSQNHDLVQQKQRIISRRMGNEYLCLEKELNACEILVWNE